MSKRKKCFAVIATLVLLFCFCITAIADENNEKNKFTLEELQDLAVKNSRNKIKLELIYDQAKHAEYIYSKEYDKARTNSIGNYALSKDEILYKEEVDQAIDNYENMLGFEAGKSPSNYPGLEDEYNHYLSLQITSSLLQQQIVGKSELIEGELDLLTSYGIADTNSLTKELKEQRDEARDNIEDLERKRFEVEKQIRQTTALLILSTVDLNRDIELLKKAYDQHMKMLNVEKIKKEYGMTCQTDIDKVAVKVSNYAKQLKYAQANLKILKEQINDLIGKEMDASLEIIPFQVADIVAPAPTFSQIFDEVKDNTYDLYVYDREIKQLEKKNDNYDDSNKKTINKNEVEKTKLAKKDKEFEIQKNIKTLLANYSKKAKACQLAQIELKTAEQEYRWNRLRCENELISNIVFSGKELIYTEALNQKISAGYDFYLAKEELNLARQGVFLPESYYSLKSKFFVGGIDS